MSASAATLLLLALNRFYQPPGSYGFAGSDLLLAAGFATVGLVIGTRRPENVIGWLFGSMGIGAAASEFTRQYALRAVLLHPGSLPAGEVVAWLNAGVVFLPTVVALPLVFLLFPDGRFLSRRWRAIAWVGIAGVTAGFTAFALMPGPLDGIPQIENPFGVGANRGPWQTLVTFGFGAFAASLLAGLGSLVVRFRRSRADERQQLKWLGLAAALFGAVFVAGLVPFILGGRIPRWVDLLLPASFVMIAAGAAVAVLKYRLYEIDLVINRTLAYTVLTVMLVSLYIAMVFSLQALLRPLTPSSDLAIVASTLSTAAMFNTLRRRVQAFVDRRFYRRKYDVQKTLEALAMRLRDEVDMAILMGDVHNVLNETLQPAHIALWLRPMR